MYITVFSNHWERGRSTEKRKGTEIKINLNRNTIKHYYRRIFLDFLINYYCSLITMRLGGSFKVQKSA